jgi:hypothetical protein
LPAAGASAPLLPVAFVEEWWARDTSQVGTRARGLAGHARARLERTGLPLADPPLMRCLDEGPDGTQLSDCLKLYIEDWGMVFVLRRQATRLVLLCLAFGHRHPQAPSRQPSVYQLAHRRLHHGSQESP